MNSENWQLRSYLPANANHYCFQLWQKYRFQLRITAPRKTKLGDYRFRASQKDHLITINSNLNPFTFLVVYVHEVAHCVTTIKHGPKTKPHGRYWQNEMRLLSFPLIGSGIFPEDIEQALASYLQAPKAASCTHPALTRALRQYDEPTDLVVLEQLAEDSQFEFQSRLYKKMKNRRTRVSCLELTRKRVYLISKLAMVSPELPTPNS